MCAFGGNAGWGQYYGGPNDSGTGLFVNNTDQPVKNDGVHNTVGSLAVGIITLIPELQNLMALLHLNRPTNVVCSVEEQAG